MTFRVRTSARSAAPRAEGRTNTSAASKPAAPPNPANATPTGWVARSRAALESKTVDADLAVAARNITSTLEHQTRHRGLPAYIKAMPGLDEALRRADANPNAHWVDVGGGHGNAQRAYQAFGANAFHPPSYRDGRTSEPTPNPRAMKLTLIDLEPPAKVEGLNVIAGNVETMDVRALKKSADIVTDNIAAFSYSTRPDLVLRQELAMLSPTGTLFLGLGQSNDLVAPAVDSSVVTRGGRVKSYGEWLQANETLAVVDRTRTYEDDGAQSHKYAYEITRKPGVEPQVPELEPVSLQPGGPPRVTLLEKGAGLFENPAEATRVEHETRQALSRSLAGPNPAGALLDLFRSGPTSNLLAQAVRADRGAWLHLGPISPEAVTAMNAGTFEASARYSAPRIFDGLFPKAPSRAVRVVESADALSPGSASLISDSGFFLSSTKPQQVLQSYFTVLENGGTVLLNLGRGAESEVQTRAGHRVRLSQWLEALPGVATKRFIRRGADAKSDETLVRLEVRDAALARQNVPPLEALGAMERHGQGNRIVFREPGAAVVPSLAAKGAWARLMDYAWGR